MWDCTLIRKLISQKKSVTFDPLLSSKQEKNDDIFGRSVKFAL